MTKKEAQAVCKEMKSLTVVKPPVTQSVWLRLRAFLPYLRLLRDDNSSELRAISKS